jgi:hypothetical protein
MALTRGKSPFALALLPGFAPFGQPSQGMMLNAAAQLRLCREHGNHGDQHQAKQSQSVVTDDEHALTDVAHDDRQCLGQRTQQR